MSPLLAAVIIRNFNFVTEIENFRFCVGEETTLKSHYNTVLYNMDFNANTVTSWFPKFLNITYFTFNP